MAKIKMKNPIVEMDGDEMTRVQWKQIKDELLSPFVELNTDYYDLGLENRDRTGDRVTHESAERTRELGVAVKCATITPNDQRMEEYDLKEKWPSPNATIRAILDGTVFRTPILVPGIEPTISSWKKPITIARHAYGDIYKAVELSVPANTKAELLLTGADGSETRQLIYQFAGPGIVQGVHNRDDSITAFARSCFDYALSRKEDLWFSTKDTISKNYDARFKAIFADIYEQDYRNAFADAGIEYFYTLIDDAVARVVRSDGGFIWALKNYDGDVMSDMLASASGSLAMMTSVLVSPDGTREYEAAHGTVTRHYYRYLKGEDTSTNPVASIYAWTGALARRGELDGQDDLVELAGQIEDACIAVIAGGKMTGDLARISTAERVEVLSGLDYIRAVRDTVAGQRG